MKIKIIFLILIILITGCSIIDNKVNIIVYIDYSDKFVKQFFDETYEKIKETYIDTNKATFTIKHFPLQYNQNSLLAANAIECAKEQGKFWQFHFILLENQENLDIDSLKRYAVLINLDTEKFNLCLDNKKHEKKIENHIQEGKNKGVIGVPTFFINEVKSLGPRPFSAFQVLIEEEIKK